MKYIIGFILTIISTISILFAWIFQIVLVMQKYGIFVSGNIHIFVPHWSAFFFLGFAPLLLGIYLCNVGE